MATVDGHEVDLSTPLRDGAEVAIITADSNEGREVLRHSTAHVLAQAVLRLWPGAKYAIGPVIDNGFYYDFELPDGAHFTDEDLGRLEAEMRAITRKISRSFATSMTSKRVSRSSPISPSSARSSRRWGRGRRSRCRWLLGQHLLEQRHLH